MTQSENDPKKEWKLSRIWAQGVEANPAKYRLQLKDSSRYYTVEPSQMPQVLIKAMQKGAIEVYFTGDFEGLGKGYIVGPVEVLEGRKW